MKQTKSEYHIQAEKFLSDTLTTFKTSFLGYQKYFKDDKEKRNVFEIELCRNGKVYIFRFGASINDSKPQSMFKGMARKHPKPYDVLACLTKYDPETFDDFCANYGYDTDSRKALDAYLAVQDEWNNVNKLFHDVLDELREIN